MKWNNGNDQKQQSGSATGVAGPEYRSLGVGFGREDESREEVDRIDFKMVSFSLAGKDYGIDIMKLKEIAKFENFTYVPNTRPFVAGVYNLRGEIISIIDLRVMFNLPNERHEQGIPEDGLILRVDDTLVGVIVDRVDRVVGIASESIQPPHPIFADINIRYISGVVEHDDRLYIILDVARIFSAETEKLRDVGAARRQTDDAVERISDSEDERLPAGAEHDDFEFVTDALATFEKIYATQINQQWLRNRFEEWRRQRTGARKPVQFTDEGDAAEFVAPFLSPCSHRLWDGNYSDAVRAVLPTLDTAVINAWNPGCGKGYETYSIAALMSQRYRGKRIKIWAGDNDLLSISTAPNLILAADAVPAHLQQYTSETSKGISFTPELKEAILFEYHDIRHESGVPESHVIVCRDLLSILSPDEQERILVKLYDTLISGGVLIIGENERLHHDDRWEPISEDIQAYRKV